MAPAEAKEAPKAKEPEPERTKPRPPKMEPPPATPVMEFYSAPMVPEFASKAMPAGKGLKAASASRLALRSSDYEREYLLYLPAAFGAMPPVAPAKDGPAKEGPLEAVPLVLCFHGMNVDMYWAAFNETTWGAMAETHGLVAAFPQSQTIFFTTHWDFWSPSDLLYTDAVLADVDRVLRAGGRRVDPARTYAVGISNGGLFVSNVAIYFSERLAAVCNYMGGWMEDGNFPPEEAKVPVPMLIVIGDQDRGMMGFCRAAERVFKAAGWPVDFVLSPGVAHKYEAWREPDIWAFFQEHARPAKAPAR